MGRCEHEGRGPRGGRCKECRRERNRRSANDYRARNPEKVKVARERYEEVKVPASFRMRRELYHAFADLVGHKNVNAAIERMIEAAVQQAKRRSA